MRLDSETMDVTIQHTKPTACDHTQMTSSFHDNYDKSTSRRHRKHARKWRRCSQQHAIADLTDIDIQCSLQCVRRETDTMPLTHAHETCTSFLHEILMQVHASSGTYLCRTELHSIQWKKFVQEKTRARKHVRHLSILCKFTCTSYLYMFL